MKSRGFSIVELTVVIVVIGILLIVGMVSFNNYQANARDEQRQVRAENIARYLESLYSTGSTSPTLAKGSYPSTSIFTTAAGGSTIDQAKILGFFGKNGFDIKNLHSSGKDTYGMQVLTSLSEPSINSDSPDYYYYQPIALNSSGARTPCTTVSQECRSFNLYYTTEADISLHVIRSAQQ